MKSAVCASPGGARDIRQRQQPAKMSIDRRCSAYVRKQPNPSQAQRRALKPVACVRSNCLVKGMVQCAVASEPVSVPISLICRAHTGKNRVSSRLAFPQNARKSRKSAIPASWFPISQTGNYLSGSRKPRCHKRETLGRRPDVNIGHDACMRFSADRALAPEVVAGWRSDL